MFLTNFLGLQDLYGETREFLYKYVVLSVIGAIILNLTSTFYLLYIIDNVGFLQAGIIGGCLLFVQFIFDYPSGSLADKIGHRWVYALSIFSYGIALSILVFYNTFEGFIVFAFFQGFGTAQLSGVLESWVDNNYKVLTDQKEDPERKIYGFFMNRLNSLTITVTVISFIIGGFIATSVSRQMAFAAQVFCMGFLILLILKLMKNHTLYNVSLIKDKKESYSSYFAGGIKFFLSSWRVFFFILGISLVSIPWMIWGNLILFPLYFGYAGNDMFTSVLRTIIFIIGVVLQIFVFSKLSKKISDKWQPYLLLGNACIYFTGIILILTFNPIGNSFNILGFVSIIFLQNGIMNMFMIMEGILRGRIMIDLVPSEFRNAIYSLIPTIYSIISVPVIVITGSLIESYGLIAGILMAQVFALLGGIFVLISHKLGLISMIHKQKTIIKISSENTNAVVS